MSDILNEDGRFLKILNTETMKVVNHYQIPLQNSDNIWKKY